MSVSRVRQNYSQSCETKVNEQINWELYASYVYMAMSYHFDRDDVAQKNIASFFKKASEEEREHAYLLMTFQNQRGGRITYSDILAPTTTQWDSIQHAMEDALALERKVNQALLDLHKVAGDANDPQMCDFIETHYLTEQVEAIKELSDYITNLERAGKGLGEFMFNNEFKH